MKTKLLFSLVATVALTACSQEVVPIDASRVDNEALMFHNDPINEGPVLDQVATLNASADALVGRSTVRGAVLGAAVGCGLVLVSSSNARRCLAGAAVGGAGGAFVGNMAGQQQVQQRVNLVSSNDLVRDLRNADAQIRNIRGDLPAFLAAQEAELNNLMMQLINGEIEQAEHDARVAVIQQDRADLATALEMSARDARQTANNLERAAQMGQGDLDWHIETANQLADDVQSTRSTFSML
mgnify:CR=1 FL=1